MAGPRVSIVVHDGCRITDKKTVTNEFRNMNIMDVTKAFYRADTKYYSQFGAEEVTSLGSLRKDAESGFQLYLAVKVGNEVVEMGLPFVQAGSGADAKTVFLNPSNIRVGDVSSLAKQLPTNAEILLVWRLDRNMTQDIVLKQDSRISQLAPSQSPDFSLLEKKACLSCAGGASGKIEGAVPIINVRIFCGESEDPIRMGALIAPEPEAFIFDVPAPHISCPVPTSHNHLQAMVDFVVRNSWEDEMKQPMKSRQAAPITVQFQQPEILEKAMRSDAPAEIIIYAIPKTAKIQPATAEIPVIPALNPSEKALWEKMHNSIVQIDVFQPREKHAFRPLQESLMAPNPRAPPISFIQTRNSQSPQKTAKIPEQMTQPVPLIRSQMPSSSSQPPISHPPKIQPRALTSQNSNDKVHFRQSQPKAHERARQIRQLPAKKQDLADKNAIRANLQDSKLPKQTRPHQSIAKQERTKIPERRQKKRLNNALATVPGTSIPVRKPILRAPYTEKKKMKRYFFMEMLDLLQKRKKRKRRVIGRAVEGSSARKRTAQCS